MAYALRDSDRGLPIAPRPMVRGHSGPSKRPGQCGGCGTAFDPGAWAALSLVAVLTGDAIATHVLKWPQGARVEIRRCSRCGRSIARIG